MTVHYADDAITLHHGGALDVSSTALDLSLRTRLAAGTLI